MKLKSIKTMACMVIVTSVLSLPFASASAKSSTTLKFGHVLAPDHPYNLGALKFKEIVEELSEKNITVNVFPSSQLGNERDLTEGLQLGTVDIALAPGTIASFEPKMRVFDLPYIFDSKEQAYKILDGEVGQEVAADLPLKGLRLLSYWENGFRHVTNSKNPVIKAQDLEGLKIRVPGSPIYVETYEALGANTTTMSFGELYTALQQKTIDGQENPIAIIYTNKFYETQPHLSLTRTFYMPAHLLISEVKWKKLSQEQQEIILRAAQEARDYERALLADSEQEQISKLQELGVKVQEVDLTSFKEATQKVRDKYREEFGEILEKIQQVH